MGNSLLGVLLSSRNANKYKQIKIKLMRKLSFLFAALFALMAMAACNEVEEPSTGLTPQEQGCELVLRAEMGDYTRATDVAFEEGDRVGLYLLLSMEHLESDYNTKRNYIENGLFVADSAGNLATGDLDGDGVVTDNDKYYWYTADYTSTLAAYYPYQAEWSDVVDHWQYEVEFTVNADQSTHALYTASDLMSALATAAPSEEAVALPFTHKLSKVAVTINNQLGEEIVDLYLAGVLGSVKFNLETQAAPEAQGTAGTIKMAPVSTRSEAQWVAIVAPQTAKPQLIVTTATKQYTFELTGAVEFVSGKQLNAAITLSSESVATDFTTTVTEWTSDKELNFHREESGDGDDPVVEPDLGNWGVTGDFNAWSADEAMTALGEGLYTVDLTLYTGQAFKVRKDGKWDENYGSAITGANGEIRNCLATIYESFPVCLNGGNMVVTGAGRYTLTWDTVNETMSLTLKEKLPEVWGVIGSFNDWTGDVEMTFSVEDAYTMAYTAQVELKAGDEFKVRRNASWDFNYGLNGEVTPPFLLGSPYLLIEGGNNFIVPVTGTYTISFSPLYSNLLLTMWCENGSNPDEEEPAEGNELKLYAHSEDAWSNMNLWAWDDANNYSGGSWPGVAITEKAVVNGVEYFVYTFDESMRGKTINIIFNNGSFQTQDITGVVLNGPHYYKIYSNRGEEVDPESYTGSTDAPSEDTWGVIGGFSASGWATDVVMSKDAATGMFVAYNIYFNAGEAFKIRANGVWDDSKNYGLDGGGATISTNTAVSVITGGGSGDMAIPTTGYYDIYFDLEDALVYAMTAGQVPATR